MKRRGRRRRVEYRRRRRVVYGRRRRMEYGRWRRRLEYGRWLCCSMVCDHKNFLPRTGLLFFVVFLVFFSTFSFSLPPKIFFICSGHGINQKRYKGG